MDFYSRLSLTLKYLSDVRSSCNEVPFYFENVVRYMLCTAMQDRCDDIILVERPYMTDIHPFMFSAMSYDPVKCDGTPSVSGMASMLAQASRLSRSQAEEWFRDSWMYYSHGIFLFNVCVTGPFDDINTFRERVLFTRYLSRFLQLHVKEQGRHIRLLCIGLKAHYVGRSVASSLGVYRKGISVVFIDAPGTVYRKIMDSRDAASLERTFELKLTANGALSKLGERILEIPRITEHEFFRDMAANVTTDLIAEGQRMADELSRLLNNVPQDEEVTQPQLRDIIQALKDGIVSFHVALTRWNTHTTITSAPATADQGKKSSYGRPAAPKPLARTHASASVTGSQTPSSVSHGRTRVQLYDGDDDEPVKVPTPVIHKAVLYDDDTDVPSQSKQQSTPTPSVRGNTQSPNSLSTPASQPRGRSPGSTIGSVKLFDEDDESPMPTRPRPSLPTTPTPKAIDHTAAPLIQGKQSMSMPKAKLNELLIAIDDNELSDNSETFQKASFEYMSRGKLDDQLTKTLDAVLVAMKGKSASQIGDMTLRQQEEITKVIDKHGTW